jgi:hypothetical protein
MTHTVGIARNLWHCASTYWSLAFSLHGAWLQAWFGVCGCVIACVRMHMGGGGIHHESDIVVSPFHTRRRRSEEEEEEEEEAKKGINARIHEDRKHWKEGERTRFATA